MATNIKNRVHDWIKDKLEKRGFKIDSNAYVKRMMVIAYGSEFLCIAFSLIRGAKKLPRIIAAIFLYGEYTLMAFMNILYMGLGFIRPREAAAGKSQLLEEAEAAKARLNAELKECYDKIASLENKIERLEKPSEPSESEEEDNELTVLNTTSPSC